MPDSPHSTRKFIGPTMVDDRLFLGACLNRSSIKTLSSCILYSYQNGKSEYNWSSLQILRILINSFKKRKFRKNRKIIPGGIKILPEVNHERA
jgi:hypothetical protein